MKETVPCNECGSLFYCHTSQMAALCPECAHHLYGYDNCGHSFDAGRCTNCYWDGSESDYIARIKRDADEE